MQISVIMPVYNETIYELKNSINSILNQDYRNFEFIIVDDNPKSVEIKKYLLKRCKKNNRIRVYFNKKNEGSMASANFAINKAHGKYIARMDADDISYHNRLSEQLHFCNKYDLDFSCCNFNFIKGGIKQRFIYNKTLVNKNRLKRLMDYTNPATGPTLFFNRKSVKNIGGYRNVLSEDYDLLVRMLVHGYRVGYLSIPLVYKRYRKDSLSESNSLKDFIALYLMTKYSKKTRFHKILSEIYINNKVNSIRKKDMNNYYEFIQYCRKYRQHKNIKNMLMRYIWACSTPLIFKRNLTILRNKIIHLFNKHLSKLKY